MSAADRRVAILDALVPVFAKRGLRGATTRALAKAAGVSEALLYRHFPSKRALYAAIQRHVQVAPGAEPPKLAAWRGLPPSTAKLVEGVRLMMRDLLTHSSGSGCGGDASRLVLQSLLEDGAFARRRMDRLREQWFAPLREALRAARRAGDVAGRGGTDERALWFLHHVGFAARSLALPGRVVDHGVGRARLVDEASRFALRGLGVREPVLDRAFGGAKRVATRSRPR